MHGSTPGAGFMDRISGHDFYLELVREEALNIRTRVFFPEQNDLTLLSAILDNRWREFGSDRHRTVGVGEWAPRGSSTYGTPARRARAAAHALRAVHPECRTRTPPSASSSSSPTGIRTPRRPVWGTGRHSRRGSAGAGAVPSS